jgi:hypothetical protein
MARARTTRRISATAFLKARCCGRPTIADVGVFSIPVASAEYPPRAYCIAPYTSGASPAAERSLNRPGFQKKLSPIGRKTLARGVPCRDASSTRAASALSGSNDMGNGVGWAFGSRFASQASRFLIHFS